MPTLDPKGEYLETTWRNSVYPLSEQMGIKLVLPPVQPRTRLAHEAAEFAQRQGKMAEMAHALFKAFFQEGRDIGQVDVLCDVGRSAGLNPEKLRSALEERTLQEPVGADLELSRRLGISAVPAFIVGGRYLLEGLVSEEYLLRAIRAVKGEGLVQIEE